MIDIENEELISLAEAAGMVPCGRKGRSPNVKTVYLWTTAGCRGVVLSSVQAGGKRCTSKQAVYRFIEDLTLKASPPTSCNDRRVDAKRLSQFEAELDQLGV